MPQMGASAKSWGNVERTGFSLVVDATVVIPSGTLLVGIYTNGGTIALEVSSDGGTTWEPAISVEGSLIQTNANEFVPMPFILSDGVNVRIINNGPSDPILGSYYTMEYS